MNLRVKYLNNPQTLRDTRTVTWALLMQRVPDMGLSGSAGAASWSSPPQWPHPRVMLCSSVRGVQLLHTSTSCRSRKLFWGDILGCLRPRIGLSWSNPRAWENQGWGMSVWGVSCPAGCGRAPIQGSPGPCHERSQCQLCGLPCWFFQWLAPHCPHDLLPFPALTPQTRIPLPKEPTSFWVPSTAEKLTGTSKLKKLPEASRSETSWHWLYMHHLCSVV